MLSLLWVPSKLTCTVNFFQDMFDPELYLSEYEFTDATDGIKRISTSRFRDATTGSEEDIKFESAATKNGERLSYFCTEIPCEAGWVTEAFKALDPITDAKVSKSDVSGGEKRTRDDEDEEVE